MRVILCESAGEAVAQAVARLARVLRETARPVLGLATGGTMAPVYAGLVAEHRSGLSLAGATSFNLDEYVGLPPGHPQSYRAFMQVHLFHHVDLAPSRSFVPCGDADPAEAARAYEAALAARGPVDLQLLGLGANGHIGFNEPGSSLASRTREVLLTAATRAANARFFAPGEQPPVSAVTMGVGTILEARAVLLLALGAAKAEALARVVEGPVTALCPGSALQLHPEVTVIADPAAGARLTLAAHYREAEAFRRHRSD